MASRRSRPLVQLCGSAAIFVSAAVAACGPQPAPAATVPAPAATAPAIGSGGRPGAPRPAPTPPAFRLPTEVRPTGYEAELTVDPAQPAFTGRITIDVEVARPTDVVWFNAEELTIVSATIEGIGAVEVLPVPPRLVALRAATPLPPGFTRIEIVYRGVIARNDSMGVFAQQVNGDWYATTQLEPLAARRVFPCFDEPSSKVPWQLTLRAPRGLVVVSNTPIETQSEDAGGLQTVRFARTPPLPSYLLAFAIGPYEIVDAGKAKSGAPVRIFTPRGQAREAAWAVESTAPLLSLLEDYFGTPYPFAKLDIVPIPQTFSFGAMENPGMITYVEDLLLHKPEELTSAARRLYADVAVHEMAHQWFGNLVTSAWWDDIWLNEALATWIEPKIMDRWKPEWNFRVGEVRDVSYAMGDDSLDSARRVREPVRDENDILNAFDGITYGKGAAVLRMVELWVGEDAFQQGLRAYLKARARGTASYAEFVADMSAAIGRDLAGPLSSFFEQNGAPLISFASRCVDGKLSLELTQRRYLPLGSKGEAARTWQVPVCVRYGAGAAGKSASACTLLAAERGTLALPEATSCNAWVMPNQGGAGYYRSLWRGDLLARLLDKKVLTRLPAGERLSLRNDATALAESGDLDLARVLELSALLADDPDRFVRQASVAGLWSIEDVVPDALRPNYQRFVRRVFGAQARKLGFAPKRGESDETAVFRPVVLYLVGRAGADPAVLAEAERLAWRWLDDHAAVDPAVVDTVLGLAARRADRKLHDRLLVELRQSKDLQDRQRLIGALGGFVDPKLVQAGLALVLSDELPLAETIDLVWAAAANREVRELAWKLVTEHYDALIARLPREYTASFVNVGLADCSASRRAETAAFFAERNARALGGPRVYENALETLDLCIAYRARHAASVEKFLRRY